MFENNQDLYSGNDGQDQYLKNISGRMSRAQKSLESLTNPGDIRTRSDAQNFLNQQEEIKKTEAEIASADNEFKARTDYLKLSDEEKDKLAFLNPDEIDDPILKSQINYAKEDNQNKIDKDITQKIFSQSKELRPELEFTDYNIAFNADKIAKLTADKAESVMGPVRDVVSNMQAESLEANKPLMNELDAAIDAAIDNRDYGLVAKYSKQKKSLEKSLNPITANKYKPQLEKAVSEAENADKSLYEVLDPDAMNAFFSDGKKTLKQGSIDALKSHETFSKADFVGQLEAKLLKNDTEKEVIPASGYLELINALKLKAGKDIPEDKRDRFETEFSMWLYENVLTDDNGYPTMLANKLSSDAHSYKMEVLQDAKILSEKELSEKYGLKDVSGIKEYAKSFDDKAFDDINYYNQLSGRKDINFTLGTVDASVKAVKDLWDTRAGFKIGVSNRIRKISEKVENGKTLTPAEKSLMTSYAYDTQLSGADKSISDQIFEGTVNMLPYIAGYSATAALTTKTLTALGARSLTVGTSLVESGSYLNYAAKNLPKYLLTSAVQTAMNPQMYLKGMWEKQTGTVMPTGAGNVEISDRQSAGTAFLNASLEAYSEIASERAGEELMRPFKALGKGAKKGISKVLKKGASEVAEEGVEKVSKFKKFFKTPDYAKKKTFYAQADNLISKKLGIGSAPEEFLEEKLNEAMNIVFDTDNDGGITKKDWKQFTDAEQNIVTAGIVSVFGIGTAGVKGVVGTARKVTTRGNKKLTVFDNTGSKVKITIPTALYNEFNSSMRGATKAERKTLSEELYEKVKNSKDLTEEEKHNFFLFTASVGKKVLDPSATKDDVKDLTNEFKSLKTVGEVKDAKKTIAESLSKMKANYAVFADKNGEDNNDAKSYKEEITKAERQIEFLGKLEEEIAENDKAAAVSKAKAKSTAKKMSGPISEIVNESIGIEDDFTENKISGAEYKKLKSQLKEKIKKQGFFSRIVPGYKRAVNDELTSGNVGNKVLLKLGTAANPIFAPGIVKSVLSNGSSIVEINGIDTEVPADTKIYVEKKASSNAAPATSTIKEKYKAKLVYSTPTTGKTYAAMRDTENLVDGDVLMSEVLNKIGIKTTPEKFGLEMYKLEKNNPAKFKKAVKAINAAITAQKKTGKTVLTGSRYFMDKADVAITSPYAEQIATRSKSLDRKKHEIKSNKASEIINREVSILADEVKLKKGAYLNSEIYEQSNTTARKSKEDDFDSQSLASMSKRKQERFIKKLQKATDLKVSSYHDINDKNSATIDIDKNGNASVKINMAKAKMSDSWHELSHPILISLRKSNPEAFNKIYDELINADEWKEIRELAVKKVDAKYTDKELKTLDDFKEEVLATALGYIASKQKEGKVISSKLKSIYKSIMDYIGKLFSASVPVESISTIGDMIDAITGEKGKIKTKRYVSEKRYSKFGFLGKSNSDVMTERLEALEGKYKAKFAPNTSSKESFMQEGLGSAFMVGRLAASEFIYNLRVTDEQEELLRFATSKAMKSFMDNKFYKSLSKSDQVKWKRLARAQYEKILKKEHKENKRDMEDLAVEGMAGVTATSEDKINSIRTKFSGMFSLIASESGYEKREVEKALFHMFNTEAEGPNAGILESITDEDSYKEVLEYIASGSDIYSKIANVLMDKYIDFEEFTSINAFYSSLELVERTGAITFSKGESNSIKNIRFYAQNIMDNVVSFNNIFRNHFTNRKLINKDKLQSILSNLAAFNKMVFSNFGLAPTETVKFDVLAVLPDGSTKYVKTKKTVLEFYAYYMKLLTGIDSNKWMNYFNDSVNGVEMEFAYYDAKLTKKIPNTVKQGDMTSRFYIKSGARSKPWNSPRIIAALLADNTSGKINKEGIGSYLNNFFLGETEVGISNLEKLANAQMNGELELDGKSITHNRFSSFVQNSNLMSAIKKIREKVSLDIESEEDIVNLFREAGITPKISILQGLYDVNTAQAKEMEHMSDKEYFGLLLGLFIAPGNNYKQTLGQFGDKTTQYLLEMPKQKATDENIQLVRDILKGSKTTYEDEVEDIKAITLFVDQKALTENGVDAKTLAEDFVVSFILNRKAIDKYIYGKEEKYKNLVELVKRAGSTNSPGYSVKTNVEGGMEDTFTHAVLNELLIRDKLGLASEAFDGMAIISGDMAKKMQVSMGSMLSRKKEYPVLDSIKAIYSDVTDDFERALTKTNWINIDVLVETFGEESIYGQLKDWMENNEMDSISFESGTKKNETGIVVDLMFNELDVKESNKANKWNEVFDNPTSLEDAKKQLNSWIKANHDDWRNVALRQGVLNIDKNIPGKEYIMQALKDVSYDYSRKNIKTDTVIEKENIDKHKRKTEMLLVQQDLRHQTMPEYSTQSSQMWSNMLTLENENIDALMSSISNINQELFNIFYGGISNPDLLKQMVLTNLDRMKDEDIIEAIKSGRSLTDPAIINKAYTAMADILSSEIIDVSVPRVTTQEIPDVEGRLLGLREIDSNGNIINASNINDAINQNVNISEITNHSGGALGADTAWDTIGKEFGMTNNKHYWTESKTPNGNSEQKQQAQLAYSQYLDSLNTTELHSKLGNKTESGNVKIVKDIFASKSNKDVITAFRVDKKLGLLESFKKYNAIGNPINWQDFKPRFEGDNATIAFMDWFLGKDYTNLEQEYRQEILNNLDNLRGKTIEYYKELGRPSHATALDYLINQLGSKQDIKGFKEFVQKTKGQSQSAPQNKMLLPEIAVNIKGVRYAKEFQTKEEALSYAKKILKYAPDLKDENGKLQEWQIYQGLNMAGENVWIVPGEPLVSTRVPADDLHSHTVARARHRIKSGNFTMLDKESQARSGSDFDGDQRFNWVLAKEFETKGQITNDQMEGTTTNMADSKTNQMLFEMMKEYQNPKNTDKILNAINTKAFDSLVEHAEAINPGLNNEGFAMQSVMGLKDARKNNLNGVIMKGLVTDITTVYSYLSRYGNPNEIVQDKWGNMKWALGILLNLSFDNAKDPKIEKMGFNEVTAKEFIYNIISNKDVIAAETKEAQMSAIMAALKENVELYNSPEGLEYIKRAREAKSSRSNVTGLDVYQLMVDKFGVLGKDKMGDIRKFANATIKKIYKNKAGGKVLQKVKDFQRLMEGVPYDVYEANYATQYIVKEFRKDIITDRPVDPRVTLDISGFKNKNAIIQKAARTGSMAKTFTQGILPENLPYFQDVISYLESIDSKWGDAGKITVANLYALFRNLYYAESLRELVFYSKKMEGIFPVDVFLRTPSAVKTTLVNLINKSDKEIFEGATTEYSNNKFLQSLKVSTNLNTKETRIEVRKEFAKEMSQNAIFDIKADFEKLSQRDQMLFLTYAITSYGSSTSFMSGSYYRLMSNSLLDLFNEKLENNLSNNFKLGIPSAKLARVLNNDNQELINSKNSQSKQLSLLLGYINENTEEISMDRIMGVENFNDEAENNCKI